MINGRCSNWLDVKSGVPQGSVLGPLLFIIFVNDIDDKIKTKMLKFADDMQMVGMVGIQEEIDLSRKDLKNLVGWAREWQMLFNLDKCKVMHIGRNNEMAKYEMNGKELIAVDEEKDLGIKTLK